MDEINIQTIEEAVQELEAQTNPTRSGDWVFNIGGTTQLPPPDPNAQTEQEKQAQMIKYSAVILLVLIIGIVGISIYKARTAQN